MKMKLWLRVGASEEDMGSTPAILRSKWVGPPNFEVKMGFDPIFFFKKKV
jgi:hypothetical protein